MKRIVKLFAIAVGLALPATAHAQPASPADQTYCMALSDTYVRYIGHSEDYGNGRGHQRGPLEGQVAVAKCKQGDAAAAIPVLEKELIKQKFSLPARG